MKRSLSLLVCAVVALSATACSSPSNHALRRSLGPLPSSPHSTTTSAPPTTTPPPDCDPTQSYAPDPAASEPTLDKIRDRGMLVVGVDQGTYGWGFRDPRTGDLSGLEIDLLQRISREIFGDGRALLFKTVTTAQRIDAVERGDVDMVASLLTATCARWQDVDFSTVYYVAHQDVMVAKKSDIRSVADLAGHRVCATRGSTSIANIADRVPKAVLYPVDARSDCLVALQEGEVDAITSDDTILRSFQAPEQRYVVHTKLLGPIDPNEREPYAIAIDPDHQDLTRFVNDVLQRMRDDDSLRDLYVKWLGTDAPNTVPAAAYR